MSDSKQCAHLVCEFEYRQYDWGEMWTGTKAQLQAAGIGQGASFPGEAGAPKKLMHVTDWRGVKVTITNREFASNALLADGVFQARSPYIERPEDLRYCEEGSVEFAAGVTVLRCYFGADIYRGNAVDLVSCGVVTDDQLPGRPGRGETSCTFLPDGSPKAVGNSRTCNAPGIKWIRRLSGDRFEVQIRVSLEERENRKALQSEYDVRRKNEDLAARWAREELTERLYRSGRKPVSRTVPVTWRVIANKNPCAQLPRQHPTLRIVNTTCQNA